MQIYHKIHSIFKRDPETNHRTFLEGQYSRPEFLLLKDAKWVFTEKIDGTNIRVCYEDGRVRIGGHGDNSSIPIFLLEKLQTMFTKENLKEYEGLTLFGEGYGNKIQKCGKKYIEDGVSFILFDIQSGGGVYLKREDCEVIAYKLGLDIVPIIGFGTLQDGIELVKDGGYTSEIGDLMAEGIVARPDVELLDRMRQRIITKIKVKDYAM